LVFCFLVDDVCGFLGTQIRVHNLLRVDVAQGYIVG
jgi:hypothetical protein